MLLCGERISSSGVSADCIGEMIPRKGRSIASRTKNASFDSNEYRSGINLEMI